LCVDLKSDLLAHMHSRGLCLYRNHIYG
jgi:hypothetical protein